jgi:iron complex transport system substrate-binding protein
MGRVAAFVLLLAFSLYGADGSLAATFIDEVGRTVELPGAPQRIVSVAPSVTEILFAIGLGDKVVGVSTYCNFPPEARKKEKVGSYITPSLEKIIALRPDLVVGTADGDLKTFVDRLSSFGIPVYITHSRSVAGVFNTIRNVGKVTLSEDAAEKLVASLKQRSQEIEKKVQGRPRPRVLNVLSLDPLIASGPGSFVDDLIRLAGGRNMVAGLGGSHPRLSMEEIIAQDPEVILLSSMTASESLRQEEKGWSRWKSISAVRSGRICILNPDLIHRPSPRIIDGLEELVRVIHPEVFK